MMYDELVKWLRDCGNDSVGCGGCPYNGRFMDGSCISGLLAEAADAIEELQAQIDGWIEQERNALLKSIPKWIPVEERLPEEIGNYLVVINCPRGRWDEICAFDGEKEWVSIDEYAEIATKWVTHWMPLPEPPKEE